MKLYTVAIYTPMMCMNGDISGLTNIKGDNLREIIICDELGYCFKIGLTALVRLDK